MATLWSASIASGTRNGHATSPPDALHLAVTALIEKVADWIGNPEKASSGADLREPAARIADLRRPSGSRNLVGDIRSLADLFRESLRNAVADFDGPVSPSIVLHVSECVESAMQMVTAESVVRLEIWHARDQWERQRAMQSYTDMLSHELANRLGAAETAVALIVEPGDHLTAEQSDRLLETILHSIQSGLGTVQSVRSLFTPNPASGPSARQGPIGAVIRNAVHQIRIRASDAGITLALKGSEAETLVDAERFPLVFFNLVTNAIDHHDLVDGSGTVTVDVREEPNQIEVRVTDDGPGIPADLRPRVFEPRVSGPSENGTGLGLAIAKQAAAQMGACLRFECGDDRGTAFIVTIPKDQAVGPAPSS